MIEEAPWNPPGRAPSRPADSPLDAFALDGDSWLEDLRRAESPPALGVIGEYVLECEIGRGGQGVVHRAVQPRIHRRIAVKRLIAGSLSDARTRARFEREIEACAALHHPSIVTVYGMEYVGDLPVLAMEWVDGLAIDAWADQVGRDRQAIHRLVRIFLRLCAAIQHAHQRGVIHRDIKPSNILVTDSDDVKVLDFGLAKYPSRSSAEAMELTATGEFMGTPAYCSPEKLAGERNVSEVGGDVFSLGVVLYRMLAGRLPFSASRSVIELLTEMRSRLPVRVSAHNAAVARDLDAICACSIAAEPERRYASVDLLIEDIRRFLNGEPVSASGASVTYRAVRFVRRHKALAVSTAMVLVTLVGATVITGTLAVREASARAAAEKQVQLTQNVLRFLNEDLLSSVRPERTSQPELTVRAALDLAATRIDGKFDSDPIVEASIRRTLGRTYLALGLPSQALPHVQRAHEVLRNELGATHAETRNARRDWIEALFRNDEWQRAGGEAEQLLALDIQAEGAESAAAMATRHWLARARPPQDPGERVLLFGALASWNKKFRGESHPETLSTLHSLANDLLYANRLEEAEPVIEEIVRITQFHYGPAHPETFDAIMGQSLLLAKTDRIGEAVALLEESIRIQRESMPANFATTGIMLGHLGSFYGAMGRVDESERALLAGYEVLSSSLGPNIGWAQGIVRMLGDLYERKGDVEKARVWRSRLLQQFEKG